MDRGARERAHPAGLGRRATPPRECRLGGALQDDRVIGFASYDDFRDAAKWPGYRFTVEHTIHVHHVHQDHQDHQGVGVGGVLLDALIERALEAGKHSMIGAVDGDNAGSIRFHERHGFAVVGRLPELGFKFGRWLDHVLMQRMHV